MICAMWHSYAYEFNICNSFHHILTLKSFNAVVFNVFSCLYTHIRHIKGFSSFLFGDFKINIFSAVMPVCHVMLLSLTRTNWHQEMPFRPSASQDFHPRQLSDMLCAVFLAFIFNYFAWSPSQSFL